MMDRHTRTAADDDAGTIAQAVGVEGGDLFIGHNGNILHYACGARLHGYDDDASKAACVAAGLPVIDARQVASTDLWRIVVSEPEVAVGTPDELRSRHWAPHAPLTAVAGLYRAAWAKVLNLPAVTAPVEAAP